MSQERAENSHYALEAKGLSTVLGGQKVLEIPSLRVKSNEVLMVIGPNGSGKTTLLLALALLLKPRTGKILYKDIPVTNSDQALQIRRRLALVFQEPLLLNSTVWDNITLGLRLRGVKGEESRHRAEKWLERFGIAQLAKRQARMLSHGEAKRVSLARAFVLQPEVLFLDEPFNTLDSPTRQTLLEDFESVLRETKVTTVMVTHDRNEAQMLADRVAVLMNGSIYQLGTPEEVFGSPIDEEVARFVGVENIIDGVIIACRDKLVTIAVGNHVIEAISDCLVSEKVHACIRPEDVTIDLSRFLNGTRNCFSGVITHIISTGQLTRVEMDCGFPLVALVPKRLVEELSLNEGKQVYTNFKATTVHVIKEKANGRTF